MKLQDKPYTCGPAAVQNALRALGVRIGQGRIAHMCGTDSDGTDENDLRRGLEALGSTFDELCTSDMQRAARWLDAQLTLGHPVVLCVDKWQHWIAVIGVLGARNRWRAIVVDSSPDPFNSSENGVHVVSRDRLMRRWRAGWRTARHQGCFFAIAVTSLPAHVLPASNPVTAPLAQARSG